MKTVSITRIVSALMISAGLALGACKNEPAQTKVGEMSVSELEAAIADGKTPKNADQIKLRLARIYAKYGSDTQRANGLSYIGELAEGGSAKAAALHCREPYFSQGKPASVLYCTSAAQGGDGNAQYVMCKAFHGAGEAAYADARKMCQAAVDSGVGEANFPLGIMISKGDGGPAFPYRAMTYLEAAIEKGSIDQRTMAIAVLSIMPEAEKYHYKSDAELGRTPSNEKAAVATVSVQPEVPRNLRQNGQCRMVYEITPTGYLFKVNVDCSDPSLVDPVLKAAHQWRFEPRTVRGVPAYTSRQSTVIPFTTQ